MVFIVAVAGCTPALPEFYEPTVEADPIPLTFSADGLESWVVEDACAAWSPEGVSCSEVDGEADLRVEVDDGPCLERGDGDVLARHDSEGEPGSITVYEDCFEDEDVVSVLAHEVGHALGVYFHVAEDCDEVERRDPRSPPVCGLALMNPIVPDGVDGMTVADHEAWLNRNPWLGVDAGR